MVQVRWGCLSIKGNFRENNEDSFIVDPRGRFFIVADGMGGQSAGEKASALATELVPRRLEQTIDFEKASADEVVRRIDEAVAFANGEIMALSTLDPEYHNMGTTIAFMLSAGGKFFVAGVGDSRVYRLRGDQIEQLTRDHSLTQALLEAQAGDRFMLCSDGVTDGIKYDLDQLARLIKMDDPQAAAAAIIKAAEDGGSKDNITCIVVHCV